MQLSEKEPNNKRLIRLRLYVSKKGGHTFHQRHLRPRFESNLEDRDISKFVTVKAAVFAHLDILEYRHVAPGSLCICNFQIETRFQE